MDYEKRVNFRGDRAKALEVARGVFVQEGFAITMQGPHAFDAAGPGLLEECRTLGGCPTGAARLTGGHDLPARHVIHTVGPVYRRHEPAEAARLLDSCYTESLRLAERHGLRTIAFPGISTGVYGYPKQEACDVAVRAVDRWLAGHDLPRTVIFCCFGTEDAELYRRRLGI